VFRVSLIIIVNNKRITAVPDGGFPPLPCSICWRRVTTTADRTQFYSFHTHTHTHTHKHMLKGWKIQHAERFVHQEKNKTIYFQVSTKRLSRCYRVFYCCQVIHSTEILHFLIDNSRLLLSVSYGCVILSVTSDDK